MTTVVLGAKGLLGSHLCQLYPVIGLDKSQCDITKRSDLFTMLLTHRPTTIINCSGITPKGGKNFYQVNAYGPKLLETLCEPFGTRIIHVSTNCVFSGVRGNRTEAHFPDPKDDYGMSKYLGEITRRPHLTIRTSFVGLPDPNGRGLLAWAEGQENIRGYRHYSWNGLTTVELAKQIMEFYVPSKVSGLVHLFAETISKFELLTTAQEVFGWDKIITPVDKPEVWHTLDTIYVPTITKSFATMLREMREAL
jgi:dTDP-4-dehydrorhamnose reductase